MSTVQVQTAQNVAIAYRTAGVGTRIVAYLIDALITIAYLVIGMLIVISTIGDDGLSDAALVFGFVVFVLPVVFYHLLCEIFLDGQSLGKRAAKIKVVRLDGGTPTIGAYLLRWILRFADITIFYGVPATVLIIVTEHDQRLGDLAAGTTVIRLDDPAALNEALPLLPGEDHVVQFPQVRALSDEDVRTVNAVLARLRAEGRTAKSSRLADRTKAAVEDKMGIAPVAMSAHPFLRQVARDYAALDDTF